MSKINFYHSLIFFNLCIFLSAFDYLKNNKFTQIKITLENLTNTKNHINITSNDYRRLAYDEIFSNLLMLIKARKIV